MSVQKLQLCWVMEDDVHSVIVHTMSVFPPSFDPRCRQRSRILPGRYHQRNRQGNKAQDRIASSACERYPRTSIWRVSGRDAIAGAVGLFHVVDGQDTPAGVVALPIDEVDGHAAANPAVVREQGVEQGPDLRQCEVGTLREQAVTVRR